VDIKTKEGTEANEFLIGADQTKEPLLYVMIRLDSIGFLNKGIGVQKHGTRLKYRRH
jgi:hypothetical protein